MKKKSPSENDSAHPAGRPQGATDDVDDDAAGATLREVPRFDRTGFDAAARAPMPPSAPEVPADLAIAKTLIGAEVPAEIRDRAKARSEKSADKPMVGKDTVIVEPSPASATSPSSGSEAAAADPALEGADGAPTTPLELSPAAVAAPAKVTAIVEAVQAHPLPTPAEKATRARWIVVGIAAAIVVALFIPGIVKARRPSVDALQEAYKSGFREPHLANPRADMISFELVKSAPCATHPEDTCLLYDLTAPPRYSSQMAVYKGADGWVLERHGVEK